MIFRIILLLLRTWYYHYSVFLFYKKREAGETMQHLNELIEKAKLAIESIQE